MNEFFPLAHVKKKKIENIFQKSISFTRDYIMIK